MPRKKNWTIRKMTNDLRKCGEVAKKSENEGEGLLFCTVLEDEWRRMHPRSKIDGCQLM